MFFNKAHFLLLIVILSLTVFSCVSNGTSRDISGQKQMEEPVIKELKSEVVVKETKSWDGVELPSYPEGKPEITVLKISIPPNTRLPVHYHPYINVGFMLSGELIVTKESDKSQIVLKPGDSIMEIIDGWHYGETRDKSAVILVFYAGVEGETVTVTR